MPHEISLSVVTVVRNASLTIQDTLDSVRFQSRQDFEYIVVDGLSTDGTLEKLHDNSELFDTFVSESDSGIYAAWNKGIELSSGSHIIFLNGDDALLPNSIELAMDAIRREPSAVNIGKTNLVKNGHLVGSLDGIYSRERLHRGFDFLTTATIFPVQAFKSVGLFDETFRLAADIDWFLRADLNGVKFSKSDHEVHMSLEGASNKFKITALREYREALQKNGLFGLRARAWHWRKLAKCYSHYLLRGFQK